MNPQRRMPVWRSMLFVPVNVDRFVDKAHTRGADAIILDLEDAVPVSEKVSVQSTRLPRSVITDFQDDLSSIIDSAGRVIPTAVKYKANEMQSLLARIADIFVNHGITTPEQAMAAGLMNDAQYKTFKDVLTVPPEVFAEYQLFVDETSPFKHNMVFAYTNGCEGYVGTRKDYELGDQGGYETAPQGASLLYHGRLPPEPQVEAQIRVGITKVLQELNA